MLGIYNFVLTANFACLSTSENNRIRELEAQLAALSISENNRIRELEAQNRIRELEAQNRIRELEAALQLAQGISQFIALIYVLYFIYV